MWLTAPQFLQRTKWWGAGKVGVTQTFPKFMDSNKTKEILQARKAPAPISGQPSVSVTAPPCGQVHSWGDDRKNGAMEQRMLVPAESNQSALLEPVNFRPKISG